MSYRLPATFVYIPFEQFFLSGGVLSVELYLMPHVFELVHADFEDLIFPVTSDVM